MKLTGAQLITKLLERQGIACISGIPGGANLPMYDALHASPIQHVLARHEQGAGFIAQGMARATGQPAVCFGTSGPGATSLLTAIADARLDSVPLIAVTGQVSRPMIGTDAFQEIDTYGLMLPITKHNFLVRSAAELLRVIPDAFRIATSGRPGPVSVDVPKDVQNEVLTFDRWPDPGRPDPPPRFEESQIAQMVRMIREARRPILYIGGGVIASGAADALRRLAEENLDVKVILLNNARLGLVRQQQELFYGARFSASQFFAEPDFVTIAEGFGVAACDLGSAEDPLEILEGALREPGPCVIHVPIAPGENVFPMVPPAPPTAT